MKTNLFVLCLIGVIATLIGVGLSVKATNDPLLKKLVIQQQDILAMQQALNQKINQPPAVAAAQGPERIQMLEDRVAALEKKLQVLDNLPKFPSAPPQRVGPPQEDFSKVYDIPVGTSPLEGKADAKVTITGFLDLQCPFSARFQPVIDQVLAAYPGKVKYMIKHFPLSFHPQAKPAAKAVLAAGQQGKYWDMLGLILKDNSNVTGEKLKEYAKTLKLNIQKYDADLKSKEAEWDQLIQADYMLGTKVEVQGTPTYFINGRKTMARDLDSFKNEVEKILSEK